jgi:hypothetical protein
VTPTRRGVLYVTAIIIVLAPPLLWLGVRLPKVARGPVAVPVSYAGEAAATEAVSNDQLAELAERDPVALVRRARERFEREVKSYRCVLVKQERIDDELTEVEQVEVRVRRDPLAIYMLWQQNANEVKRALFKTDPEYTDADGNRLARIEPAGAIVRLFVTDIFMPIHGERARKASRRSIDECGFGPTFALMERYTTLAQKNGDLELNYSGTARVDGRPTFVIERYLPYTGEDGPYPDAKLVLHLDQGWLLPVAVETYADREGKKLLGRYVFTKVELNPKFTERDFTF